MAEECCWAITHVVGWYSADSQVPVCRILDFNCIPLYIDIYLTICVPNSEFRKIRLAPDLPESNYCVSRKVSVF
jgi:hypothetical protein